MAPSAYHLYLTVFVLFVWKTTKSEIQTDYAHTCMSAVRIMDCWVQHHGIPACTGGMSPMMRCAEEHSSVAYDCRDEKIRDAVENMIEDFEVSEDAICRNQKLKQEFKNNQYCWNDARKCGLEIVTPALTEETHEDNCDQKIARLDICMSEISFQCRILVRNYTDYIYQNSTCGGVAFSSQIFVLVLSAIISSLLAKLFA